MQIPAGHAIIRRVEALPTGIEWLVDAGGCDPEALRSEDALRSVFESVVKDLGLHPLGPARFHLFPAPGGVTGMLLLGESHLTCHTFPEHGFAAFDLYCCRERRRFDWKRVLIEALGAGRVVVRSGPRGQAAPR